MAEPSEEARQFVNATYQADVAEFLLTGNGFKIVSGPPKWGPTGLGGLWGAILDELAGKGFMTRSQTGRYWWKPGG